MSKKKKEIKEDTMIYAKVVKENREYLVFVTNSTAYMLENGRIDGEYFSGDFFDDVDYIERIGVIKLPNIVKTLEKAKSLSDDLEELVGELESF